MGDHTRCQERPQRPRIKPTNFGWACGESGSLANRPPRSAPWTPQQRQHLPGVASSLRKLDTAPAVAVARDTKQVERMWRASSVFVQA